MGLMQSKTGFPYQGRRKVSDFKGETFIKGFFYFYEVKIA